MKFLKTLDAFLDKHWRRTHDAIVHIFNIDTNEDTDWLKMHNDMVEEKKKDV